MSLRRTANRVSWTRYRIQQILHGVARVGGSYLTLVAIFVGGTMALQGPQTNERMQFIQTTLGICVAVWIACKFLYRRLEPGEPPERFRPPPPPPPRATTASGRPDDPDEATVIGRLDPKLRDLLRQKDSRPRS